MLRNSNKILFSDKASERRQGRSPGEALQRIMKAKDIRITDNILLDSVLGGCRGLSFLAVIMRVWLRVDFAKG